MNYDLFGNIDICNIHINDAADKVGVSTATIRNWIKTGYLKKHSNGFIDGNSFNQFIENIAKKEKLNARANKSNKDSHNHEKLSNIIIEKLNNNNIVANAIAIEYEQSLSDSYKNKEGIYYTPTLIVNDMLLSIENQNLKTKLFCDPSCGSGNFIIGAIERGFKPENIYGFDIDSIAVEITKKRIYQKTGYHSENIIQTNFLEYITFKKVKFDFIFTNPPWGKKISKNEKEKYAEIFRAGKSIDTSALFFFASLSCLNENGILGFLLPEAFFNIATFEDARKKALELTIERLIDYGKSFKGLLTKAQAIILKNIIAENNQIVCKNENSKFKRSNTSFKINPKSILNFHCDDNAGNVIKHVYSIPHITLCNKMRWGLGIVTGNNSKYIKNTCDKKLIPVYKGSDITYKCLKNPSVFIPENLNLYQQVAPKELYEASEKLIYKFISSKLCFFYDSEQRYILNSANMMIPTNELPITCKQLCDILNSKFMTWLFSNIFNTHKVLRGDLEMLPIHNKFFNKHSIFKENKYLEYLNIEEYENGTYRIKG